MATTRTQAAIHMYQLCEWDGIGHHWKTSMSQQVTDMKSNRDNYT